MSEKKTITINPDLFKLSSGGKTKKSNKEKIKIKPTTNQLSEAKNNTLKRKILKVIRARQQDEYKRLFSKTEQKKSKEPESSPIEEQFTKDFDKSLQYLTDLEKKVEKENVQQNQIHNHTFRNYEKPNDPVIFNELPKEFNITQSLSNSVSPIQINSSIPSISSIQSIPLQPLQIQKNIINTRPYNLPQHPGYGCLKGGKMPTYRTFKNKQGIIQQVPIMPPETLNSEEYQTKMPTETIAPIQFIQNNEKQQIMKAEAKQIYQQKEQQNNSQYKKIKNMKRRKIYKRTYHVGKSKNAPKIGCLISNKTIRKKIQQTAYDLKHTNIKDVRKFLLKRGFIKVGTSAPNDVLRKMYESVAMVCGEVQNHNPDNLLYNFVNDNEP